jgi:hypothetical protein
MVPHTQLSSARIALMSQMLVVWQSPSQAVTIPPLVKKVLYSWKALSLLSKTSVRLCQKAGVNDCDGGRPTSGPYV